MAISLTKGANISLAKEAPDLTVARLGLGWGKRQKKGLLGGVKETSVDLDASCLLFGGHKNLVDQVWFGQLRSRDGSIVHSGDDLVGGGGAEDPNEEITVRLNQVPDNVDSLVFTVNSFSGESFDGIPNAFCALRDHSSGKEIARFNLSVAGGGHTGLVIAKLYRHSGAWKFKALGDWGEGRTYQQLLPVIQPSL
ncbi:MAG: TerD family protein [Methylococcales bacterium]